MSPVPEQSTPTGEAEPPPTRLDAALEAAIGLIVIGLIAWTGFTGWHFYNQYLLPNARSVPTPTATPAKDPAQIQAEARRFRQVSDHVGAGIAFRQANRPDLAVSEFNAALALDPANPDARQNLKEMGIEPPPLAATPTPSAPTPAAPPTVKPRA